MSYFHPKRWLRLTKEACHNFFWYYLLPDSIYLRIQYKKVLGAKLNLNNPQTLNEKIQWLKLYDRNPRYHQLIDKYEGKQYVASVVGQDHVFPTLGIYDSFDEIDFDQLPNQFVLKCVHDAASTIICKDKSTFDRQKSKTILELKQKCDYYHYEGKQWGYKGIKPRIICEPYMEDETGELKDYKIFCFNGRPEYVEVDFNRWVKHKLNPYDFDWNPLNFCDTSLNDYDANIPRPKNLDQMREFAEKLSKGIPFVRVDFYSIKGHVYVGELTFYPGGGYIQFNPREVDLKYGKMLDLSTAYCYKK